MKTEPQTRWVSWWAIAYVWSIIIVNVGFTYIHPIDVGFGLFSPMALFVGAVFIFRDYTQCTVGRVAIFLYMAIGLVLSYIMADPFVASASALAFAFSETIDWLVFTYTKKPIRERVIISNVVSIPVDTVIFLSVTGFWSLPTFVIMVLSKLVATLILRSIVKRDDRDCKEPY